MQLCTRRRTAGQRVHRRFHASIWPPCDTELTDKMSDDLRLHQPWNTCSLPQKHTKCYRQNKTECKFSRVSSSSKPQAIQKQTNHLATASWVLPEGCLHETGLSGWMGSKHIRLEEPSWQQLSDLCIVCGFEEENSLVNLLFFCVLLCLIKKRSVEPFVCFIPFFFPHFSERKQSTLFQICLSFASVDCSWYSSSSVIVHHYLFWRLSSNQPVFRSFAVF